MANEYYITAGLVAIDSADIGSVTTNAFYITAGLVANDRAGALTESLDGTLQLGTAELTRIGSQSRTLGGDF